jgi:hypothetical protein
MKEVPEKLKPIAESWKLGENTILYTESRKDGITTLVLGTRNSIKTTLYELIAKTAEKLDMGFLDLIEELIVFMIRDMIDSDTGKEKEYIDHDVSLLNELMGDENETEENH